MTARICFLMILIPSMLLAQIFSKSFELEVHPSKIVSFQGFGDYSSSSQNESRSGSLNRIGILILYDRNYEFGFCSYRVILQ